MSEILISAGELKTVLAGFAKIIGRKTTLPILQHLKITRGSLGSVTLQATDLDVWATYRVANKQPGEPVTFFVPFAQLSQIIKPLKAESLITFIADSPKASRFIYEIGGRPVESKLEQMDVVEWPAEPVVVSTSTALTPAFKLSLKEAMECASTDTSRYTLSGACVDVQNKDGHYVVATNGQHLYAGNSFKFDLTASILIPAHKFINWSGLAADGDWRLSVVKKQNTPWLKITSDHWDYVSKQIEGNYPNWRQVMLTPDSKWTRLVLSASDMELLLKSVPLLPGTDNEHSPVTIDVRADKVLVKGYAKEDGKWTETIIPDVKVTGKAVEIALNREYLLKAMRFGLDHIDIQNPFSPLLFSAAGKTLVVMPVLNDAAKKLQAEQKEVSTPAPPKTDTKPAPEERKTEPHTMTAPERGNLKPVTVESNATKEALEKVEAMKIQLRDWLGELNDLTGLLKSVEKEKRSQDKEVASVRHTIRQLQTVRI